MDNNPLRQYFRRPAVYLKLPSGIEGYKDGVIDFPESGELPIYPMTAIDEITSRTPDALYNGTAVAELMKSCIPCIKDPWSINSTDLDAVLIAIKAASGNGTLELNSICPKCNENADYGIDLMAILSTLKAGDYNKEFERGELKLKFRPLTYKEINDAALSQFEIQRMFASLEEIEDVEKRQEMSHAALEKITMLTMEILCKAIEYIETPTNRVEEAEFILDFLKNCDRNTYVELRDYNSDLKMSTELKPLDITCTDCGNEYKQPFTLSPSDFFD